MNRLSLLESHLTATKDPSKPKKVRKILDDVWDLVGSDEYMSEKGIAMRKKCRAFMLEAQPKLIKHINECTFPHELVKGIHDTGINGFHIAEFGGPGLSPVEIGACAFEFGKIDASLGTFVAVHNCLGMTVIDMLGSEEQRKRYLPDCMSFKKILAFGLTEPEFGSDATGLQTTAKKVEGGYILNGRKKWMGNSTFDNSIVITWARNEAEGGKIQGFLVHAGSPGFKVETMQNKYALRMV